MRRAALLTLLLTPLLACTSVEPEPVEAGEIVPPSNEEILVSKNELDRAADNLNLQVIELFPGESPEQAIQRVLGRQMARDVSALLADEPAPAPEAHTPDPEPEPEPAPDPAPQRCDDSCEWANDGVCDDGGPNSQTQVCAPGTDCSDCDGRGAPAPQPEPDPEPDPQPAPDPDPQPDPAPAPQADPDRCDNTCRFANDGECDDGSPGAAYDLCVRGSDCNDCSGRAAPAPADPAPAPADPPPAAQDDAYGQACLAGGLQGRCGDAAQCSGRPVPGHCPGAANIQCCVPDVDANEAGSADHPAIGQRCDAAGRAGTCQRTAACNAEPVPGYCAGPADIQCCVEAQGAHKALPLAAPVVLWGGRLLIVAVRSYVARQGAYVGSAVVAAGAVHTAQRQVGVYIDDRELGAAGDWDEGEARTYDPTIGPMTDRFLRQNAQGQVQAPPQAGTTERGCEYAICGEARCRDLQDNKGDQCNQSRSCGQMGQLNSNTQRQVRRIIENSGTPTQMQAAIDHVLETCEDLQQRYDQGDRCVAARREVMDECFGGGDRDHHDYLAEARRVRDTCQWKHRQYLCDYLQPYLR